MLRRILVIVMISLACAPSAAAQELLDGDIESSSAESVLSEEMTNQEWTWTWLPAGLIYRSYMAGLHEPRMSLITFYEVGDDRALADATLGGRVAFLRYGDQNPLRPQGYELDFYGAAIPRLDVDRREDLDSADFVFGLPITYGVDDWQFKFGYAHLSSHLGDERAIREPGALAARRNFTRDGLVLGVSRYLTPYWRQYGEIERAFNTDGGAQPLSLQFGAEFSRPGSTKLEATPFLAVNTHLREENDFGGDFSVQAGWLRRGEFGQTLRFGAHYFNGKSSQFQFFDHYEQQIGMGLWYDF
jgi:hypothetical protein